MTTMTITTEHKKAFSPADIEPKDIAVAFLVQRITTLPKESLADLASLATDFAECSDAETFQEILQTIKEILFPEIVGAYQEGSAGAAVPTENLKRRMAWIGSKIKEKRKAQGLTQEQLAEMSGLPQSHISRLEGGRHSPSFKTLEKIALALSISVGELDPAC